MSCDIYRPFAHHTNHAHIVFRPDSTMKTEQHYNPNIKRDIQKKERRATTGDLAQFIIHLSLYKKGSFAVLLQIIGKQKGMKS